MTDPARPLTTAEAAQEADGIRRRLGELDALLHRPPTPAELAAMTTEQVADRLVELSQPAPLTDEQLRDPGSLTTVQIADNFDRFSALNKETK